MSKRSKDIKVKTLSLPGERGPEIQHRLTQFNQTNKMKPGTKTKNVQSTKIATKNLTTNVVHVTVPEENENTSPQTKDSAKSNLESTTISLKEIDQQISDISGYGMKPLTEFCCAHEKDATGSWIAGIEFVQDGHIILLDTNNCKLKRFNTMLRFLSSVDVPVDCANLTKISSKEIAVTCLNEVHFYSIGHFGISRSPKHFDISGDAYGISYEDGRYSIISDVDLPEKQAIRILDIFGDEIHVIKPQDCVGEITLGPYCQISAKHNAVAVSDFDNRMIYCFNFKGSLKWKCSVEGGPRGLIKVGNDFIVSDNYGQEICAISVESGKKRTLLQDDDGVFNPELLAVNHKDLKLAITQRAFDTISMFNLTKDS